ncbi:MAG TPA: nickel pincer cofactor biosynthesis protein LarC [Chloroflexota bacterium]|nr:nickel pincer cofactor biosynthesis protein LarC [Chloroflexota bacterium]
MNIAYLDCFSGLSGDMFLGCLLDAGLSLDALREALASLPVGGYQLDAQRVTRQGISGTQFRVVLDRREQPHRHLAEVEAIIRGSALRPEVQEGAVRVFRRLAEAEAIIHGTTIDEVHFHEVGAVDAIVDITGAVWGLHALGVEQVYASSVPTGSGTVNTGHGILPVPAPATLALLASAQAPLRPSEATTELVTPTGAALLASFATFRQPALRIERVGYGFGQKTLPWPNVARIWLGQAEDMKRADGLETDFVVVLEANLDDERPEMIGAAMDSLLAAGALDVFFTPIQMKKNRPAVKLTALAPLEKRDSIAARLLRETSTLGVRTYLAERLKCRRWIEAVETPWGTVRIKIKEFAGEKRAAPEFEDCLARSREHAVPLPDVYAAARAAATAAGYVAP